MQQRGHPHAIEPGHLYMVPHVGHDDSSGFQFLKFLKRSGGSVQHENEHEGTNVQSVLRVLIDRTKYLDGLVPCVENKDVILHLRMALLAYEGRAYRRKLDKVNRGSVEHESFRERNKDLPFDEGGYKDDPEMPGIEELPVGPDGHIIIP